MSIVNLPGGDPSSRESRDGRQCRPLTSLPTLVGDLIYLREVNENDGDAIVRLLADPVVTQHQLRPPPRTREEVAAWIRLMHDRRSEGRVLCFAITFPDADRLVGLCQLNVPGGADEVEWGWLLETSVWGTGVFGDVTRLLCAFARAHFGATALVARVHKNNRRAVAALVKIGSTLRDSDDTTMTWTTSTAVKPSAGARSAVGTDPLPPDSESVGEHRR
jgi:RimJ/RimL family protein N-acetyltransferase